MAERDDGGPVFPTHEMGMVTPFGMHGPATAGVVSVSPGMSLRDYFAAAALPQCIERACVSAIKHVPTEHISDTMRRAAFWAREAADAMLAELKK